MPVTIPGAPRPALRVRLQFAAVPYSTAKCTARCCYAITARGCGPVSTSKPEPCAGHRHFDGLAALLPPHLPAIEPFLPEGFAALPQIYFPNRLPYFNYKRGGRRTTKQREPFSGPHPHVLRPFLGLRSELPRRPCSGRNPDSRCYGACKGSRSARFESPGDARDCRQM